LLGEWDQEKDPPGREKKGLAPSKDSEDLRAGRRQMERMALGDRRRNRRYRRQFQILLPTKKSAEERRADKIWRREEWKNSGALKRVKNGGVTCGKIPAEVEHQDTTNPARSGQHTINRQKDSRPYVRKPGPLEGGWTDASGFIS